MLQLNESFKSFSLSVHVTVRPGMGPIYMNEVKCVGQEKSIWNCPFKNITSEDCQHMEDAAVRCNVPYMGFENSVRPEPPH